MTENTIKNSLQFFQKIFSEAKEKNLRIIDIPKDVYHLEDSDAQELHEKMIKNGFPKNCGDVGFSPEQRFIHIKDLNDIIIEGNGSEIITHGIGTTFFIENCENLTLNDLKFNSAELHFSEGIIVRKTLKFFDVKLRYPEKYEEIMPLHSWLEFDPCTNLLAKKEFFFKSARFIKEIEPGIIRIPTRLISHFMVPKVRRGVIIRHFLTNHATILLFNCKNIKINNVNIETGQWGILGQRTKDIKIQNLQVRPKKGRILSINADATHWISCSGDLEVDSSYFEGHGDDALNTHTFYYTATRILDSRTVETSFITEMQTKIFDYPDEGDLVEFVDPNTLKSYSEGVIKNIKIDIKNRTHMISFNEDLPFRFKVGHMFANISRIPKLKFINNVIYNNRARGILVQTRNALIKDNKFRLCTGTGIYFTCSTYWREAPSTSDIIIEHNEILNCGGGPGTQSKSGGITIKTESKKQVPGVHKNYRIINNRINCNGLKGIHIEAAENIELFYNKITESKKPIKTKNSINVIIKTYKE